MQKTYVYYCNRCRKNIVIDSEKLPTVPKCCGYVALHAIKVNKTNNIPDYVKNLNRE